jgi:RNA polymerase-binding transcription factor DksA
LLLEENTMPRTTDVSTASTWSEIRAQLGAQRAEAVQQREEALAECAQSVPDPVAQRRVADLKDTIDQIDAALARIEDGSYGRCAGCGADIPAERLQLRPFASSCVSCTAAAH